MYKCTECGLEFENKPDFCDCGNDEFVLTVEEKTVEETVPEPVRTEEKTQENIQTYENISYNNSIQHEPYKLPVSPYALAVFILCIIFSLFILFLWNPVSQTTEKVTEIIEKVENKNIPSIDKLWKTPAPVVQTEHKSEPVIKQEIKQIVSNIPKPAATVKQPVAKPKNTQPVKAQTKVTQPKTQPKTQTNVQKTVQQPTVNDAQKQAEEAVRKAREAQQKAEQEALIAAQKAKEAASAKQELYNYKINLRNEIGKKIDFTRVIGDGDCAITFKIDQNGKLINRSFAKQSSNITLNNSVYNAVMATPVFQQPPKAYNNETLRLNISFTNGNFAITLE